MTVTPVGESACELSVWIASEDVNPSRSQPTRGGLVDVTLENVFCCCQESARAVIVSGSPEH
ncbi:MAG TPA: hypothetical protein VID29_05390, partial [Solirubrobacteraceae bacterium]